MRFEVFTSHNSTIVRVLPVLTFDARVANDDSTRTQFDSFGVVLLERVGTMLDSGAPGKKIAEQK